MRNHQLVSFAGALGCGLLWGLVEPNFTIPCTKKFGDLGTTKVQIDQIVFTPLRVVDLNNQRGERTGRLPYFW